jgi:uncharacterized protein YyaL (SSP411 family)
MPNALADQTSPYLLQHKDNPVDWQPWGPAVLARARADNKPILLSVGYAACHWCHVMAHESFEDAETAALMNELFVNVKVDREERPDIDAIYQTALQLLGEQGGWPLTMFLNPDGEPFWGGTYFPPEPRYGRPGFRDVLRGVRQAFDANPEQVAKNRDALVGALTRMSRGGDGGGVQLDFPTLDAVAERIVQEVDLAHGGLGRAPKFPQVPLFTLLWRAYLRTGNALYRDAVAVTLTNIAQGGIYDHLGGGFARYSVDERWLAPHFEKMLYDNAQIVSLLTLVWQETRNPLYAARVRETVEWLLREMIADGGGFAATLDADSEGEEGRYYVWTVAEIDQVLGADAELFHRHYDVQPLGNWEGKTILNRLGHAGLPPAEDEARLAPMRTRLLAVRDTRVRPGWDDKILADWNGLMIAALAEAAAAFGEPLWLAAAERAFQFVTDEMVRGSRLRHSWRLGKLQSAELLDDYANMARAAMALYEGTGDTVYLAWAQSFMDTLDVHFWDADHGGYFLTADDAESLIVRTRSAIDNATPSGNGIAAQVMARVYHLTGEDHYRARAQAVIDTFSGDLQRNVLALPSLLIGFELLARAVQVAVIGARDDPGTADLLRAAHSHSVPDRVLLTIAPDAPLRADHPAHGKGQVDGKPTAYVCVGPVCSLPLTEPAALAAALAPETLRKAAGV